MGAKFLHSRYADLHKTLTVELVAQKNSISSSADPVRKIEAWLHQNQIEFENATKPEGSIARQMLKEQQYPIFLTERDNVPEEFFVRQQELARQVGHGYIELTAEYRQRLLDIALADEKQSLDHWLDYFLSADSNDKPIWFKQWVLFSIRKLGKFDPETGRFAKKSVGTVAPFPDFNPESLSLVWDLVFKQVTNSAEFKEVIDFGTLYGRVLRENKAKIIDTNSNDGRWVIYQQGSDHQPLVASLKGMNTGWCTAGESTAQTQLSAGDFHVFYTRIGHGDYNIPRVAIRMENGRIAEIRGVEKDQNVDAGVIEAGIIEQKLTEFGSEGTNYQQRVHDMKWLTQIEKKISKRQELSIQDLEFLYELKNPIQGFGQKKDPRIQGLLKNRNHKRDISLATGYKEKEISTSAEEIFERGIKIHWGNLDLDEVPKGARFPTYYIGDLSIRSEKLNRVEFSKYFIGSLDLGILTEASNVVLPHFFQGPFINLSSLKIASNFAFPKRLERGGSVFIGQLKTGKSIRLPEYVEGYFNREMLMSFDIVNPGDLKTYKPIDDDYNSSMAYMALIASSNRTMKTIQESQRLRQEMFDNILGRKKRSSWWQTVKGLFD